jgi:hypothetical protein
MNNIKIVDVNFEYSSSLNNLKNKLSIKLPIKKFNEQMLILSVKYKVQNEYKMIRALHFIKCSDRNTLQETLKHIDNAKTDVFNKVKNNCTKEKSLMSFMSTYTKTSLQKMIMEIINNDVNSKDNVNTYEILNVAA